VALNGDGQPANKPVPVLGNHMRTTIEAAPPPPANGSASDDRRARSEPWQMPMVPEEPHEDPGPPATFADHRGPVPERPRSGRAARARESDDAAKRAPADRDLAPSLRTTRGSCRSPAPGGEKVVVNGRSVHQERHTAAIRQMDTDSGYEPTAHQSGKDIELKGES